MRTRIWALSFILACFVGTARADVVTQVLGCVEDPCVVTENLGGIVQFFAQATDAINNGARKKIVIDGFCASACVLLADLARSHVCVTGRALFGFHKYAKVIGFSSTGALFLDGTTAFDPPHSTDIDRVVRNYGGYPLYEFKIIPATAFGNVWSRC